MTEPMNKVEKLIAELCPNGVESKELGAVGKVSMCKRIFKNETSSSGQIPFYKIGTFGKQADAFISEQTFNDYRNKFSFPNKGDVLLSASGTIGRRVIYDGKPAYFQDSNIIWLSHDESTVLNEFLYHFYAIVKWQTEGGTIQRLYNDNLKRIKIPIPPLPIQQKIVKILDTFTTLEAELEARKKQYEYYREELLTFGEGVERKTLGEVCAISSGGTPAKSKRKFWDGGNIPWLKSESCNNEPVYQATNFITDLGLENSSARLLEKNTTLMALVGATIFKTAYLEFDSTTNQNIASIKSKNSMTLFDKFIFYYMTNLYSELKITMKSYGMLNLTTLRKIKIPIPPLAEQQRIVIILDKFDALVNDISFGLPAELNARRRQYEYYRDNLLTFEPLEKEHAR